VHPRDIPTSGVAGAPIGAGRRDRRRIRPWWDGEVTARATESTPERIRAAATVLFRERGLAGASVRQIAAAAEADPSLVIRHFGSKELLFLATMQVDAAEQPLFDGPLEELGRGTVGFLLEFSEATRSTFLALLRGSNEPAVADRLVDAHRDLFVAPLRARLTGEDADLRAGLAAALVGGLLYALWVVGDETLLATDHAEIVDRYGALLQQLVTPPA
jgi:AcrR family transcriptional regulator